MPADDDGAGRKTGCLHGAQDRIRLDGDIVVHEQHERRIRVLHEFIHDPRIATGATKIALPEFVEALAEDRNGVVISRLVRWVLVALVRHEHVRNCLFDDRVLPQGLQCGDGIGRSVKCRDADGDFLLRRLDGGAVGKRLWLRRMRCTPGGLTDAGVGFGGDVEPVPAAVFEVF